jgi:hypothetical protein
MEESLAMPEAPSGIVNLRQIAAAIDKAAAARYLRMLEHSAKLDAIFGSSPPPRKSRRTSP